MDLVPAPFFLALALGLAAAGMAAHVAAGSRGARRGGRWFAGADALLVVALGLQTAALGADALRSALGGWLALLGSVAAEGAERAPWLAPDATAALRTAATLLALAWAPVALRGARRFFARGRSRVPPWTDPAVYAAVALGVTVAGHAGPWLEARSLVLAPSIALWLEPGLAAGIGTALLLGWLAFALTRLADFALHRACRTLAIVAGSGAAVVAATVGFDVHAVATAGRDAALSGALPFVATALIAFVATHLRLAMNHARDIEHLRENERKLKALADVDTLTGLPNRRHFHALASRAVEQTASSAISSILLFDVAGLKRVNAVLGPGSGDDALAQIGTTLRETLRRRDVAGRIGGDEFAVLLPRTRVADAAVVIARIHARVADRQVAPRLAPVRLSVGTAEIRPGQSLAEALRRAELSLEAAREAERRREAANGADGKEVGDTHAPAPTMGTAGFAGDAPRTARTVDANRGAIAGTGDTPRDPSDRRPDRDVATRGAATVPPGVLAAARSLQRAADAGDQPRSESTGQPRAAASAASRGSGSTATGRPAASSNDRSFAESL